MNLKNRIQHVKKKRPGYEEILNFYQKVRQEQESVKPSLRIKPILLKKDWKDLLSREGFPLLERKDFPIDLETSNRLFLSLCKVVKEANPHMAEQMKKIEEAIGNKKIDSKELLKEGVKEAKIEQIANENGLDKKVLIFLIENSIRPSIEAAMEQFHSEMDTSTWLKGYCPICGSLPCLSLLKEETGKRFLLCPYCSYQWRIDRIFCPFCNNQEQASLKYFYVEGEEAYRVDLCDKCHQYIKTIDLRKIEESDLILEDIATLHLDILASKKGYKRPIPSSWIA